MTTALMRCGDEYLCKKVLLILLLLIIELYISLFSVSCHHHPYLPPRRPPSESRTHLVDCKLKSC